MWAMPLPFLLTRITGLLSLALPATGLWLTWGFLINPAEGKAWLAIGLALVAVSVGGRWAARFMLREAAPHGEAPPSDYDNVTGAGGAYLSIECVGPKAAQILVLTHGLGASREVWRAVLPILARRFRVVMWDLAGHGESGTSYDGDISIERCGQDLRMLLQLFQRKKVVLVSHSSGAQAVLSLLREHAELMEHRVAGVVLLNGAAGSPLETGGEASTARAIRKPLLEPAERVGVWLAWLFRAGSWAGWLNGSTLLTALTFGFGPNPTRDDADLVCRWAVKTRPEVLAKGLKTLIDWDGAAASLSVPILTVCGSEDLFVSCEAAEATAKEARFGEAIRMENAGHFGVLGQPDAYAAAIILHAERAFALASRMSPPKPLLPTRQELGEPKSWDELPATLEARDVGDDDSPAVWSQRPHGNA